MPLGDVCLHSATPVLTITDPDEDTWLEGEPDEAPIAGISFDCLYQDPGAKEQTNPRGKRKVTQPTILFEAEYDDGSLVSLKAEDDVVIDAPEILGEGSVEVGEVVLNGHLFQVDGDPTPLAPPGDLIGWEARLKRVID